MPHRIFFVEDLLILIAKELIRHPYSKWDTVSLALTCRALESPALSALWASQTTLSALIRVLPPKTLVTYTLREQEGNFSTEELVCNFSPPSSHVSSHYIRFHTRIS